MSVVEGRVDTWNYVSPLEYLKRVLKQSFPPLIITVAITGGIHGKEVNPNLPETPEEQAMSTFEAYEAGASLVHVHARDPEKGYADPSGDPEIYREINRRIRELCPDIIINNTTGTGLDRPLEERVAALEANPEMCSLNLGPAAVRFRLKKRPPPLKGRPEDELFDGYLAFGSFKETEFFAKKMLERGIKPELEVWGTPKFQLVYNLVDKGLLKPPYFIELVMGPGILPTPQNLLNHIGMAPPNSLINVLGTGQHQLPMVTMGILLGCHVRVGMEDNLYFKRGVLYKSNAEQVERVVRIAKELNREIATPAEAREMLGISKAPSKY